jgi:hypothetical protein
LKRAIKNTEATNMSNTYTSAEWLDEAKELFGDDQLNWRFRCPACGHEASVGDWRDAGAPQSAVAFSCIGRWLLSPRDAFADGPGPCNYAGGGLIGLNPIEVVNGDERIRVFDFGVPLLVPVTHPGRAE